MSKKRAAVDFDGVLHRYDRPFSEVPADGPVEGALEFVQALIAADFEVIVFTTRGKDLTGMTEVRKWLNKYGFPLGLTITAEKPMAQFYLDDRGFRFEGDFKAALKFCLDEAQVLPWNKKPKSVAGAT